ncbi:LuxR C-terminal-related transcriptional regulator [Variovorax sp. EL159]|uniref:LuxR C-terminal-related transcriptional regulator n=1 Tax=Variovorax sp. EL159 TaxID=1566270 RepID=UPI00088A6771|nr:LuxR C-terminal-related transcriptional regulator [Variovorax sp. EL159]SCX66063.1 LuxR family transcriptional regulator, maltose regulon positive regulatory protein [Variovorax sp. EL159]
MATFSTTGLTGAPRDLLLKVTPPRVPRHLVSRARLLSSAEALRDCAVLVVQAPSGFGKTSLLAQWRLEYLSLGLPVAWVSAQSHDDPGRLVQSLALALRAAMGRPAFGRGVLEDDRPGNLASVTALLCELTQAALNVVLVIDEADRLPAASREALAYLLRNAPPNVRRLIAARPDGRLDIEDLVAYGQCVEIGPAQLKFSLDETLQLVQARFGARVDRNMAARLHELTEGWPLGLQLAMTIISRGADAHAALSDMTAAAGELKGELVRLLLLNLDPDDRDFLVCIAALDLLHPDLCRAVSGTEDAAARLARLNNDTPVFAAAEGGDWLRMHALARDVLRQRFTALDAAEQVAVHARAAQWLAAHDLLDEAAKHALSAGQHQTAYELAERSLYESLMRRGRQAAVIEWLAQLPADELDRRPRLMLAAAWTLASSERHEEAQRFVARILVQPDAGDALRCECALILGGAAVFADDPDHFVALHAPWAGTVPLTEPLLLQSHANRMAYRALLEGEPALARLRQQQAPRGHSGHGINYIRRWSELVIGLSYVWEGQVLLAEQLLRPAVASAEAELGRRHRFSCNLAALLAAVAWERDLPGDAATLLADRLDVLEHSGMPESLLLAYRTAARIAAAEGAEHRALALLNALDAAGTARRLPRLRIASLAEQVRLHARHRRAQTCRELCERIDAQLADPALPQGPLWRRSVEALRDEAHAQAAMAAGDWPDALAHLMRADDRARQLKQGGLHIELLGLRALALERSGQASQALIREAMDLARAYGLQRVFSDAHPDLGAWVGTLSAESAQPEITVAVTAPAPQPMPAPSATHGTVLTPKEGEVLTLLARNLSNKEIGRAMQVSETTIKWHVKNLFAKLDAGTRAQVVQRARILGLLALER